MSRHPLTRRDFLASMAAASATASLSGTLLADEAARTVKLGIVGCGGRGGWIAGLFKKHGGYEMHAVADYFQTVADKSGEKLGVDKARRFSGLSGYKKLIESGVEAVALITPPYFFPEHAVAALDAGLHVYMAKPVAVDVPGCLAIRAAGKKATANKQCFLVDYQIPTEPANIAVKAGIKEGGIGEISQVSTKGICNGFPDPPLTDTIESRLQRLIWCNDVAMGCDYIGNFDIHAIDAAIWAMDEIPIAASGSSRISRRNPHGDSRDVCSVVYEYESGIVHNHFGQALKNNSTGAINCSIFGQVANAFITYSGKAFIRGGKKHRVGNVQNLYPTGATRNIAAFHKNVVEKVFTNDTIPRAVDGALTCILGREAAAEHSRMTMEELIKANKRLEVDLKGLKI
jgi:myo-inositol 2-dehydrogenase/D-chiro-inositol 1-dehydrogenase